MNNAVILAPSDQPLVPRQADTDSQLLELWLHGRSRATQRGYRAEAQRFLSFCGKPLHQVGLQDVQRFADVLEVEGLQPPTRRRMLAAVKSLFAFGHRLGYLPFDVARPLRLPALRDTLAERILSEQEMQRMLALERHPRNSVLLHLLYSSGVRVAEICGLKWRDCQDRETGGQVSVFGKGAKTRSILIPPGVWDMLRGLRQGAGDDAPVFRSRKRGHLHPSQVLRVVKAAARRANISRNVVVHTFRHCHASHALDRGAPIHLVQQTLGHSDVSTLSHYLHARPNDSSARYLPL
jgi:integrase/recombinase XerD